MNCAEIINELKAKKLLKKRKPTYRVLKGEKEELTRKVQRLEATLSILKARPKTSSKDPDVQESIILAFLVRQQQLGLATARSMLTHRLIDQRVHPLYSYIYLAKDWGRRRTKLLEIRDEKLRTAYQYITARSEFTPSGRKHVSEERFTTSSGDVCCARFECIQFTDVESIQQVFDALKFYLSNIEISISEQLGHVTVRDDYDDMEESGFNSRVVSTDSSGLTTETNSVGFSHIFGEGELGDDSESCAVMACDCVDQDTLFPYEDNLHVRKDISGAVVLTASKSSEDKLVVTMRRAVLIKLHCPHFEVPDVALEELHDGIARWGDVMLQTVRSIVYSRPCC